MKTLTLKHNKEIDVLITKVQTTLENGKRRAIAAIENEKKNTYWKVGKHIKTHLLKHEDKTDYGDYVFKNLSKALDIDRATLYKCVQFYKQYPNIVDAPRQLSWSHFTQLLSIPQKNERKKIELTVIENNLSTRQLRRLVIESKLSKKPVNTEPEKGASTLSLKREEPYVYKYIEIDGRKAVDLGFKMHIFKPNRTVNVGDVTHYTYKAKVLEVIDGDTLWVHIDLGFDCGTTQKVRLRGIDTEPIETPKGFEAQVFIETRLKAVEFIALRNYWRDKFTRYLVDIFYLENETDFFNVVENGVFLNQQVLDEDLADIY